MAKERLSPIPVKELSIFCRQMALIVGSDITVMQGLEMLMEQAEDRRLAAALRRVIDEMQQQQTFSLALETQKGAFPEYLCSMVTVGEQSGTLDVVFSQMADFYEKEHRIARKVSSALTYPAILTVLMLGVIALLVLRILPMFEQILGNMGGGMPALTQGLMGFTDFALENFVWIFLVVAVLVIAYLLYQTTPGGKEARARFQLRSPIAGSVRRRVLTARFARSVGILLKSGVPIFAALEAMDQLLGNPYAAGLLRQARLKIQDGENLSDALGATGLFQPLFLRLVAVGLTTGFVDDMMLRAASIYDDEIDDALEKLTTAIEPTLIIVLSVIVGVILLSVMLPMISIMSSIG